MDSQWLSVVQAACYGYLASSSNKILQIPGQLSQLHPSVAQRVELVTDAPHLEARLLQRGEVISSLAEAVRVG